ncbi:MAG: Gfo/Idh/MocA family oxidoreductase [Ruminococcaceae bacterium]|nr:Gfo/Idh/MocA family oxidoreductase [Oscillospiraceae bacterium]
MENKKLKIGIVGCGGIMRWSHLPAYKNVSDRVEIVAICDIIPSKMDEVTDLAHNYHNTDVIDNAARYTDFEEFVKHPGMEAIDICTPNYLHSVFACKALELGMHVFCEKPDAVSVEEALKMKKASEDAGKVLMIMRNNRHTSSSKKVKRLADAGEFGDIYCGRCGWIRRRGIPGKGGWFTTKEQSGGGPLIDLGVHMIDLAIYIMGNPTPVAVSGSIFTKFADNEGDASSEHARFGEVKADGTFDVEDLAMGFIKFDNGACLQIEFSWASNIEDHDLNFVELRGSKAGLKWTQSGTSSKILTEVYGKLIDVDVTVQDGVPGHENNLRHFLDVVLDGAEPDFVPQQGVNMIKILSAIYESAATGKEVSLVD